MARITVEDCLKHVPDGNRFKLSVVAAQRANELLFGRPSLLPVANIKDKVPVIALREIAAGLVDVGELEAEIVKKIRKNAWHKRRGDSAFNEAISELLTKLLTSDIDPEHSDDIAEDEEAVEMADDLPPEEEEVQLALLEEKTTPKAKASFDAGKESAPVYTDVEVED